MPNELPKTADRWTYVQRITALGEPLLELNPTNDGRINIAYGGDVANGLVCLARILVTRPVALTVVTALGGSSYGGWLRKRLTSEGIAVGEPPAIAGEEPGIYGVPLVPRQGAAFSYWRHHSAARMFLQTAALQDFERLLGQPDLLLVTGITLALCSSASFAQLCQWVERHQHECSIVFDTNFRRALWPSEATARERIGRFGTFASVIATSMDDEKALWQANGVAEIVERLGGSSVELLIRHGQDGCFVATSKEYTHVPAVVAQVVDTAGAGDSHLAGYLAARVAGIDPLTAAQFANGVAAVIVGQRGSAASEDARFPPLPVAQRASTAS
jgi:2-dehydro-3-deoxygluconokinase